MTIFVFQEVEKFDNLLNTIHHSLNDLENAVKGLAVMTEQLEEIYKSFLNNKVPQTWTRQAYLSIKMLGSWLDDLIIRLENIQVN